MGHLFCQGLVEARQDSKCATLHSGDLFSKNLQSSAVSLHAHGTALCQEGAHQPRSELQDQAGPVVTAPPFLISQGVTVHYLPEISSALALPVLLFES